MSTNVHRLPSHVPPTKDGVVFVPLLVVGAVVVAARQESAVPVRVVRTHRPGPLCRRGVGRGQEWAAVGGAVPALPADRSERASPRHASVACSARVLRARPRDGVVMAAASRVRVRSEDWSWMRPATDRAAVRTRGNERRQRSSHKPVLGTLSRWTGVALGETSFWTSP